jgi:hypothetical protein
LRLDGCGYVLIRGEAGKMPRVKGKAEAFAEGVRDTSPQPKTSARKEQ